MLRIWLASWGTENEALKRRDRRVVSAEEITDEEAALIEQAEVSADHRDLDLEIGDGAFFDRDFIRDEP